MQEQAMESERPETPGALAPAAMMMAEAVQIPMMVATFWWTMWADMLLPPHPHHHRHRHPHADHDQLAVGRRLDHHLFA